MENKKVKNASGCVHDNIVFKSNLEGDAYLMLKEAGFKPEYEKKTFHVWQGKKFSVPCYDQHKDRKLKKNVWGINGYKPIDIKYTPDFIFYVSGSSGDEIMVVFEAKGFPNDRYAYVKKMFRSYLEDKYPHSMFFEVHNKKQIKAAIEIIKSINQ